MSRCFPYPPPGFEKKVGGASLIESIKKVKEKADKESKKLKKQEKKEKKREEKEKHKSSEKWKTQEKKDDHDKRHEQESISLLSHKGVGDCKDGRDQDTEQLESSISEEHGQALSIPCLHDSFDSMHGSIKRKKPETPTDASHNNNGGSLRIRLSLSKPKDVLLHNKQLEACTSGYAEIPKKETPKVLSRRSNTAEKIVAKEPSRVVKEFSSAAEIPAKELLPKVVRERISAKEMLPKVTRECKNAENLMGSWHGLLPQPERPKYCSEAKIPAKELLPQFGQESRNADGLMMGSRKPIPLQTEYPECSNAAKMPAKELPPKVVGGNRNADGWMMVGRRPLPPQVEQANIPSKELPPKVVRECRNAEDLTGSWKPLPQLDHRESSSTTATAKLPTIEVPRKEQPAKVVQCCLKRNAEDLMASWKPIPLQTQHLDWDDQGWLFEGRRRPDAKRQKADSSVSLVVGSSTSVGPKSCYLAQGDVYALPYVLPF